MFSSTTQATTAISISGKIYQILEYLKRCDDAQSLSAISSATQLDLLTDTDLVKALATNAKIQVTSEGYYKYKPIYNVKSADQLLQLCRDHYYQDLGGVSVRDLKDQWKNVNKTIDDLALGNKVLVVRQKDGKPSVVFYNEMPEMTFTGLSEFREMWKEYPLPQESDMVREMTLAGLTVLKVAGKGVEEGVKEVKGKKRKQRRTKITNTHLTHLDLSVDYPVKKKYIIVS